MSGPSFREYITYLPRGIRELLLWSPVGGIGYFMMHLEPHYYSHSCTWLSTPAPMLAQHAGSVARRAAEAISSNTTPTCDHTVVAETTELLGTSQEAGSIMHRHPKNVETANLVKVTTVYSVRLQQLEDTNQQPSPHQVAAEAMELSNTPAAGAWYDQTWARVRAATPQLPHFFQWVSVDAVRASPVVDPFSVVTLQRVIHAGKQASPTLTVTLPENVWGQPLSIQRDGPGGRVTGYTTHP